MTNTYNPTIAPNYKLRKASKNVFQNVAIDI